MSNNENGFVDNWLRHIKDVYKKYEFELDAITDFDKRSDRLVELNVIEQVRNLAKTKVVQRAWSSRKLQVHGWVYGLNSGLIKDLNVMLEDQIDIDEIYHYKF
jgi:carbonic anhydrase